MGGEKEEVGVGFDEGGLEGLLGIGDRDYSKLGFLGEKGF